VSTPAIPRVVEDARFVPAEELAGRPHVVVDGPRLAGTALALSHWRESGTPAALAADTSAAIVDRYLRAAADGPPLGLVTNNHFDEDGVLGIWLLLTRPPAGAPERRLALAAAEAGDFGTWTDPDAARVALALMALAAPTLTPLAAVRAALASAGAGDPAGDLIAAVLPEVGRVLADPEGARPLWEPGWRRVAADLELLDSGTATVEDLPELDVAIVRAPRPLSDLAVHPRVSAMRVLTATPDGVLVLRHRYETWVDYVSRPLPPRVDLTPLLPALQAAERRPGTWRFEGVAPIRPRLFLAGPGGRAAPSSLGPDALVAALAGLDGGGG
jgi:hypothetical protein